MEGLIKFLFFVVAGVFVVSQLSQVDFSWNGGPGAQTELTPRDAYVASYDGDNDGSVSDEEYRRGELARIERDIEALRHELARELAEALPSPHAGSVTLDAGGADSRDEDEEYVVIEGPWEGRATITGWKLKSLATGRSVTIPRGSGVRDVTLTDGGRAVIVSGAPGSVKRFEDDTGEFLADDWLVPLRERGELWRSEREIIMLFDERDRVVDYVEY